MSYYPRRYSTGRSQSFQISHSRSTMLIVEKHHQALEIEASNSWICALIILRAYYICTAQQYYAPPPPTSPPAHAPAQYHSPPPEKQSPSQQIMHSPPPTGHVTQQFQQQFQLRPTSPPVTYQQPPQEKFAPPPPQEDEYDLPALDTSNAANLDHGAPSASHFTGASTTQDDVGTFNGGSYRISHRDTNTILTMQLAVGCPLTVKPGKQLLL